MKRLAVRTMAVLTGMAMLASSARGMFIRPQAAPVERLIKNTEAFIKEHPTDASGYYTLARIHYLAFSRKTTDIGVNGAGQAGGLPALASDQMQGSAPPGKEPTEQEMATHARAAVESYQTAIEMDPVSPLYHLGYASILDNASSSPTAAAAMAEAMKVEAVADQPELYKALRSTVAKDRTDAADKLRAMLPGIAPNLVKQWSAETDAEAKKILATLVGDASRIKSLDEYSRAFDLSAPKDLTIQNRPISGLQSLVSYEAATRYPVVAKAVPASAKPEVLTRMADAKKALDGKRMGAMTPIVFSLQADKHLSDLVSPVTTTTFDLDGTGRGYTWPWVQPETAILAWDPQHTGQITSGWQLFGSVTFNMVWSDGYRALDALDDNRDGVLSGDELHGLVLWYDLNGNGKVDAGEIVPIEQTPIKSIKVHPDVPTSGDERAVPTATDGIFLHNGESRRTWDWMAKPQ